MLVSLQVKVAGWFLPGTWLRFVGNAIWWETWGPHVAGVTALVIGAVCIRKEFSRALGIDKLTLLAPMFLAIPMAVFGADHFVFAKSIVRLVPSWIPGHLFWVLFVGVCLLAGSLGMVLRRHGILAAALFGIMLWLFVLLMHIPAVVRFPRERLAWAIALRDLTFGAGALSLAAAQVPARWKRYARVFFILVSVEMSIAAIFYAAEHFVHPELLPGLPLEDSTPLWIPGRVPLAYLTGVVLLITGVGLNWNKGRKVAATGIGVMLLLLVIVLYTPIVIVQPRAIETGLNYLADTLMYSGAVLCLAGSYGEKQTASDADGQPIVTTPPSGCRTSSTTCRPWRDR